MAYNYNAVTVTTSATQILPANGGRRGFIIKNNGTVTVYLGLDLSVTSSNGMPVFPQDSFTLTGEQGAFKGSIYGAAASTTADVRFAEWTP